MIYLHGDIDSPKTWILSEDMDLDALAIRQFPSHKQARSWIIEELKRRSKEINRVKDRWLRDK